MGLNGIGAVCCTLTWHARMPNNSLSHGFPHFYSEGLNADLELRGQANVLYYTQLLLDSHCAAQH